MGNNSTKRIKSSLDSPDDGYISGQQVGSLVLPAQGREYDESYQTDYAFQIRMLSSKFGNDQVEAHKIEAGKVHLETIMITPSKNTKKFIVYCRGNGEFFQDNLEEMLLDCEKLNCGVVGFNFRGVAGSDGVAYSQRELVDDVKAVIDDLVTKKNIRHCDVLLKGHSLGSAIGTIAAGNYHEKDKEIFLFNGRSFADIASVLVGKDSGLVHSSAASVMNVTGWNIQAGKGWDKIPTEFKTFIIAENDGVIPGDASIYLHERKLIAREVVRLSRALRSFESTDDQGYKDTLEAYNKISDKLSELKDHRFQAPENKSGHNVPLSKLISPDGSTANDFFWKFAKQAFSLRPVKIEEVIDTNDDQEIEIVRNAMK